MTATPILLAIDYAKAKARSCQIVEDLVWQVVEEGREFIAEVPGTEWFVRIRAYGRIYEMCLVPEVSAWLGAPFIRCHTMAGASDYCGKVLLKLVSISLRRKLGQSFRNEAWVQRAREGMLARSEARELEVQE